MIAHFFDDPRHRKSEELAFFAERKLLTGSIAEALVDFAQAARLEEENAYEVTLEFTKVRSVLAISAVALWLRAKQWDEAARAGCRFLSEPQTLLPEGCREIQILVDRAWRFRELQTELGTSLDGFVGLEAKLSGGSIRTGLAPTHVVAERRDIMETMILRVREWRAKKAFRKAGRSSFADKIAIYEAPALAASFTIRFLVGIPGQQMTPGAEGSAEDVVNNLIHLAEAASEGPDVLEKAVDDGGYAKAFLQSFRDLSADGSTVGAVELGTFGTLARESRVYLLPETRGNLSRALRVDSQTQQTQFEGVLKAVNLRGPKPAITIERYDRSPQKLRIAKGKHDDTIGPKLNRKVRIICRREVMQDGEAEEWADDVIPLEETSRDS